MRLPVGTAAGVADSDLVVDWLARRAERQGPVMREVFRRFVDDGGPVAVTAVEAALPAFPLGAVRAALGDLDAADLLQLRDGRIDVAYPFAAWPTPFEAWLGDDRVRYACCAVDLLGLAPMLGRRVRAVGACHHCGERLRLDVAPDRVGSVAGPPEAPEPPEPMVWVDTGCGPGRRITGL